MTDICSKGAVELAHLIATRELSSAEVVDAHLARIAAVNPAINAVRVTLEGEARAAADMVDRAIAGGEKLGPLAGVPFSVKENIDVAGSATTWGVAAFAGQIASEDAPVVKRLRAAGAIPFARTNLPEFASRWDTVSGCGGRTLNPWDTTRSPGGSSGGEAAALPTGMTPLGLGNDLGGSLRVPSQMCGTAALKPSRGRVAHSAVTQPWPEPLPIQMANCQGPMARRVEDLRLALSLIAAADARDPRHVPMPLEGPPLVGPIRVAVVRYPAGLGIDPHVRAGVDRAADWLSDAGYDVVDAEPPAVEDTAAAWFTALGADIDVSLPSIAPLCGPGQTAFTEACLVQRVFEPVDKAGQMAVWMRIHELGAAWGQFLTEHPIILSPVCCEPAWRLDEDISRVADIARALRMAVAVNILGLPSCAVPVGADAGLPQGVQLIGARYREDLILAAAETIERSAPRLTPILVSEVGSRTEPKPQPA